jgi:signal transduction histidine kinase/ligand-binding sensor domain-containing protein
LRRLLIFLFLLPVPAWIHPAHGQVDPSMGLDPSRRLSQAVAESWNEESGLPQSTVRAILQSPDGYLWIGTQEGLVRFNGTRFSTYDRSNTPAFLGGHGVRSLLNGPDALWVGTSGSGLLRWNGKTLDRAALPDELAYSTVSALANHPDGSIWGATFGLGAFRMLPDGSTRMLGAEAGLLDPYATSLYIDPDGTVWVGTKSGLVAIRERETRTWTTEDGLPDNEIISVFRTSAGVLSVGTAGGLAFLDGVAFATVDPARVNVQLEDRFGTHWLGTEEQGIIRMSWAGMDEFSVAQGLTHNTVTSLVEDREGSVWIGTDGGGLNRLRPAKFASISETEGLASNMAYAVWSDSADRIWVGSEDAGITVFDGRDTRRITTAQGLSSNSIMTLAGDGDGTVWAGTYGGGINRITEQGIEQFSVQDGLANNVISSAVFGADGVLWIGTDGGISRWDGDGFKNLTVDDGLPSPYVMVVHEDKRGALWAGTYDGGLAKFDSSEVAIFDRDTGLGSNMVLAIHESEDGVIWAGTNGGGLARIEDGVVFNATMREGLHDDVVYGIVEDDSGTLWMTSNKGLFTVPRADLDALAHGERTRVASMVYGRNDGLRSREFNGGFQPAAWKARDGRLIFPSIRGIAVIEPNRIPSNTVPPPVHLEQVALDGESIVLGDGPSTVGTGRVEFRFAGLSYLVPQQVRYRYKLDGYDPEWIYGSESRAVYTNLPAGDFVFRVEAANNDGLWSVDDAVATLRRAPRFWETTWFLGLCAAFIVLAGWVVVRLRVRSLRARQHALESTVTERTRDLRQEKEKVEESRNVIEAQAGKLKELDRFKTRFFANVSHEFRTPLTMIIGPLENTLAQAYGPLSGPLRKQAEIMLRNARRLLRLINQLLDLSKLEAGKMDLKAGSRDLVHFLRNLQQAVTPLAEKKGIQMPFLAPESPVKVFFEPDKMEKVFYNLLSNALKFTPDGGDVGIRIEETDTQASVTVFDTGRGIPAEQLPHIFDRFHQVDGSNTREFEGTGIGLSLVKEMVALHGGTVTASSEPGAGTRFIVVLRKGVGHLTEEQIAQDPEDSPDTGETSSIELSPEPPPVAEVAAGPVWKRVDPRAALILVVDDNPDVRDYVSGILERHGYRTIQAVDGVDGLERAQKRRPGLIISDIMMPRMDGTEFCRRVKSDDRIGHTPVILLTARASHESRIGSLEVGADDYLSKPFNTDELVSRVANLIRNREDRSSLASEKERLTQSVAAQVDITLAQRKKYEESLIAERDRALAASQLKQTILDNVGHELRTPLTGIMGYADLLAEMGFDDATREFIDVIRSSGHKLAATLDALLRLSRAQAESAPSNQKRLEVHQVVADAVQEVAGEAAERGLELGIEHASTPAWVYANPESIQTAISAVLDNAIKFTEAGAIRVSVATESSEVSIRIEDTGIGIQEDCLDLVFEPFRQVSEGLTREFDGVGIGLSIARELIRVHGGSVDLRSELNSGTTVDIRIPRVDISIPQVDVPASGPRPIMGSRSGGSRVGGGLEDGRPVS